jgi:hypothetical protein
LIKFPEVECVAIVSTVHMTEADDEWCWGVLEARSDAWRTTGDILLCGHQHGWIFHTGLYAREGEEGFDLASHYDSHGLSPELLALLDHASERGNKYVLFDRDGPLVEGLPTFDW